MQQLILQRIGIFHRDNRKNLILPAFAPTANRFRILEMVIKPAVVFRIHNTLPRKPVVRPIHHPFTTENIEQDAVGILRGDPHGVKRVAAERAHHILAITEGCGLTCIELFLKT